MNNLKKIVNKILFRIPTRLPIGQTAHEEWAKSILETYGIPDNDSTRFALSVMVMQLSPTSSYMPKHYFGLAATMAAAKEVAHYNLNLLKEKQKDSIKKAAVTGPTLVTDGGQS